MIGRVKRFIKSNDRLFQTLKKGLLYARYLKSIGEKSKYSQLLQFDAEDNIVIFKKGYHCWFGYYDKSPLNLSNKYVLYLKVAMDAKAGDDAEVCLYDLQQKTYKTIGVTRTWNWQQGAMEQWIDDKTLSYNDYDAEKNEYIAVRVNIESGNISSTSRAAYFYNKDFTKYLSLNFYRLDLFAKGYGYPFDVDIMKPEEDGIWEVNVASNEPKLVLSLAEVMAFEAKDYLKCQHYINHVAYCPNERYIIFIHRWQVKGGEFISRLLKYDLREKKLTALLDDGHVSHYCWKSSNELMIFATNEKDEKGYMVLDIENGKNYLLEGLPAEDGHPTYSNDGHWVLTDTYPNNRREQFLFLFDTKEKKNYLLDKLHSSFRCYNDFRCDLHPRWSQDNKYVIVDNTALGVRSLKLYKVNI